jgi:hypothetical protein
VLDSRDAQRFAAGARINTDDHNQLATRSAGLGKNALAGASGSRLLLRYEPLRATDTALQLPYLVRQLVGRHETARAVRLASSLKDPVERMLALVWARSASDPRRAAEHFRRALERDPTAQSARFGLLRVQRRGVESGAPAYLELAEPLDGAAAAVVAGWRHAAARDWPALRALEPALAAADVRDPAYDDALRLRVQWRNADGDPAVRAQALEIAAEILRGNLTPEDAVVTAQAFAAAGQRDQALQLLDFLSRTRRDREAVRAGVALLDALVPEAEAAEWAALRGRLTRGVE